MEMLKPHKVVLDILPQMWNTLGIFKAQKSKDGHSYDEKFKNSSSKIPLNWEGVRMASALLIQRSWFRNEQLDEEGSVGWRRVNILYDDRIYW